jgi:hypothetical protein
VSFSKKGTYGVKGPLGSATAGRASVLKGTFTKVG